MEVERNRHRPQIPSGGSGICRFGFGEVVGGSADAGDRGLEAQAADRGFHLPVIALIADKFGAYLEGVERGMFVTGVGSTIPSSASAPRSAC